MKAGFLYFAWLINALFIRLEKISFLVLLAARLWIADVFWKSGMSKLSDWEGTIALFADEYKVPLLPPEIAAYMATATELAAPLMLAFGLGSRFAAIALLVMTAVIEFSYMHFDIHLVWAIMLALILTQGAGKASVDHLIRSYFTRRNNAMP